jgi:L-alanine-DL-glutamate epimerase-like enolase superfamily enzyme
MIITKVVVFPVTMAFPAPYRAAHLTKPALANVIIKVHTDEGIVGLGEATMPGRCRQEITAWVLANEMAPVILGENPLHIERIILDRLGGMENPWLNALAAIDIALWDIAGKFYDQPLHALLGGATRRVITLAHTLPMRSPEEQAAHAAELKALGYGMLTLKIGRDPAEDLQCVRAVKNAVGELPVEVDCNEHYSSDTALKYLRQMESLVVNIEQPLPRWDLLGAAELARALDTPIIADQCIRTAHDVALVAKLRAADVICLKLGTMGGITLVRKALAVAESHGLPCTMGSAHPFGIGAAALHHFAAAHAHVRIPLGYGSPLEDLADDLVTHPIEVNSGTIAVGDGPGLGVEIDDAKLYKFVNRVATLEHSPTVVALNRFTPERPAA